MADKISRNSIVLKQVKKGLNNLFRPFFNNLNAKLINLSRPDRDIALKAYLVSVLQPSYMDLLVLQAHL